MWCGSSYTGNNKYNLRRCGVAHLGRGGELLGHEERLVPRPPGVPRLDEGEGPSHAVGGEAGVVPLRTRVGVVTAAALVIIIIVIIVIIIIIIIIIIIVVILLLLLLLLLLIIIIVIVVIIIIIIVVIVIIIIIIITNIVTDITLSST